MTNDLTTVLYLLSGVLFILAIRGLSSPDTARTGNYLGISGMAIAFSSSLFGLSGSLILGFFDLIYNRGKQKAMK